jgi:hypothetical protein
MNDVSMLLEALSSVKLGDEGRTRELRHRYLSLILDGLRLENAEALPGAPPSWDELSARWSR